MTLPLTIAEAAARLRRRELSAVELVEAAIAQADALDPVLRVYAARYDDTAQEAARTADAELARGVDRGPLHGIPIGVKDVVFTAEGPTAGGSEVRNPAWDVRRDAPVVARLRRAGAVVTGKTTTMELAVGVPDPARLHAATRNPWDRERWAGGSSSGNAAGLQERMFLGAVGTDTGGSVRIPAAYCGITGLKPTSGLVPRADVIELAASLDVVGPMARTVADAATLLQAMAGSGPAPEPPAARSRVEPGRSLRGLRIGVERTHHLGLDGAAPELGDRFEAAVAALEQHGAETRDVELPHYAEGIAAVLITTFAEGLAAHRAELREHWDAFAPTTRAVLGSGVLLGAGDYAMAQKVRRALRRRLARTYREVDAVVCPTMPTGAPRLDGFSASALLSELVSSAFTSYWNAVGHPVISIPIGFTQAGLPLGMQVAGRPFDEATVLRVAAAHQHGTDWHRRVPPAAAGPSEAARA